MESLQKEHGRMENGIYNDVRYHFLYKKFGEEYFVIKSEIVVECLNDMALFLNREAFKVIRYK